MLWQTMSWHGVPLNSLFWHTMACHVTSYHVMTWRADRANDRHVMLTYPASCHDIHVEGYHYSSPHQFCLKQKRGLLGRRNHHMECVKSSLHQFSLQTGFYCLPILTFIFHGILWSLLSTWGPIMFIAKFLDRSPTGSSHPHSNRQLACLAGLMLQGPSLGSLA